jgi:RNase P/RNase MRP subunit POP5
MKGSAGVDVGSTRARHRYIAFHPPEPRPSRHEMNVRLGDRSWRLTVYTDEVGILRVPHTDARQARESIAREGASPITTSGTIRAAKQRAGVVGS